jgi:uracil-DNA glycosylase
MTADDLPDAFASLPPAWRSFLPGWAPELVQAVVAQVKEVSGAGPSRRPTPSGRCGSWNRRG